MRNIYVFEENFIGDKIERKPKRALLMTPSEWNKFGSHLSKEQKLLEAAEQRRAEDERKQQLSKEMAKTWDNTVLNFRRRRLELRREKLDKIESDRKKRFLQTRKEEEDLKEKIISDAKEILRQDKDGVKSLNSCFRFAEVLRERAEQIKFESKLKAIEADREAKYEQTVLLDVKKFEEEVKEKEAKKIEKKKKLTAEAQEDFRQYFERKNKETEERLKLEREDNINIIREIEMEKENARKEGERKKNIILDDVAQNRKMIEEFLEQKRYEEEEEENAIKIHAAAKKKLAVIRKKKEIQMRLEAQQRRDKLSLRLATEEADRNAKEQAILDKAVAEREALEEEDKKNKKAYQERLLNELLDERKRFLEKEEEERIKDAEKAKWELMQRLKLTEENQKFVLSKKLEAINKQQENRKNWDAQCAEEKAVEAEQREQDINAVRRAGQWWEDEDKEFLSYAENLLEDSRKKGRPLLPMMRYIEEYKKQHNLVKPRSQHKTWKSNVPIDSSSKEPQVTVPRTVRPAPTKPIENPPMLKHEDESKPRPSIQTPKKPVEKWPNCTGTECKRVMKDKNGLPKE